VVHIKLAPDWKKFSPKEQRHYVVHELSHAFFEPMDHMLNRKMTNSLPPKKKQEWYDDYSHMFEYGIDSVAVAVSPSMPLPTFAHAKKVTKAQKA
jgi:hypothetical protein